MTPPWKAIPRRRVPGREPGPGRLRARPARGPGCREGPSTRARLTAVGDDWQAIFGFQGGDVDLIREFNDPAGTHEGATERIELRQTYRFGQQIADSTRRFVIRGRGAIDRKVIGAPGMAPDPRWPSSMVIASSKLTPAGALKLGGRHKGLTGGVLRRTGEDRRTVAGELRCSSSRGETPNSRRPPEQWSKATGIERRTINARARQHGIRVGYSTVHKAKGTEADYVILLDGGPPRAAQAAENRALERALRVFRGRDTAEEEERRIWYVALTRARRKVYVIVSADIDSHSPFADELYHNEGGHYDIGEDELAELLEPLRPHVPCPVCKPRGKNRRCARGPERDLMGASQAARACSRGRIITADHAERTCEKCGQGLMIRLGNGRARCQNPQCRHEAPLCRCTVAASDGGAATWQDRGELLGMPTLRQGRELRGNEAVGRTERAWYWVNAIRSGRSAGTSEMNG